MIAHLLGDLGMQPNTALPAGFTPFDRRLRLSGESRRGIARPENRMWKANSELRSLQAIAEDRTLLIEAVT